MARDPPGGAWAGALAERYNFLAQNAGKHNVRPLRLSKVFQRSDVYKDFHQKQLLILIFKIKSR